MEFKKNDSTLFPSTSPSDELALKLQACNLEFFPQEMSWLSEVTGVDVTAHPVISLPTSRLIRSSHMQMEGSNGSYFLIDAQNKHVAIIKPADEEWRSVLRSQVKGSRLGIAPGKSAIREALSYYVAKNFVSTQIIPFTLRIYLHSDLFLGPDKTKLVSIQKIIPDATDWDHLLKTHASVSKKSVSDALRVHYLTDNGDGRDANLLGTPNHLTENGEVPLYVIDSGQTFSGLQTPGQSILMAEASTAEPCSLTHMDCKAFMKTILKAFPEIAFDDELKWAIEILNQSILIEKRLFEARFPPFFVGGLFLSLGLPGFRLESVFLQNLLIHCQKDISRFSNASLIWIDAMMFAEKEAALYFSTSEQSIKDKAFAILKAHPAICKFASLPPLTITTAENILDTFGLSLNTDELNERLKNALLERLILSLVYQEIWEEEKNPNHQKPSQKAFCKNGDTVFHPFTINLDFQSKAFIETLKAYGWMFQPDIQAEKMLKTAREVLKKLHQRAWLIADWLKKQKIQTQGDESLSCLPTTLEEKNKKATLAQIQEFVESVQGKKQTDMKLLQGASMSDPEFNQFLKESHL